MYQALRQSAMVALLALSCTARAHAQAPRGLTLDEAVNLALARAPELQVAQARLLSANRDIDVASMLANPQLTAGSSVNAGRLYGSMLIPLPIFGQRGAGIEVAQAQQGVTSKNVLVTQIDVMLSTRLAWIALWQIARETAAQTTTLQRRQKLLHAAEERWKAGAAPKLEVLRTRTEAARTEAEVRASQAQVKQAATALCYWTGPVACNAGTEALGDLPLRSATAPVQPMHPLVQQSEAIVAAAEARVALEHTLRRPILGLDIGGILASPTPPINDAHAALTLEVPLLNFRGPLIERAEADRYAAHIESQAVQQRLAYAAAASAEALNAATIRADAVQNAVLPAAQEAAALATEGYTSGAFDIDNLLLAEQSLADAQLETFRSKAEQARAWALLEHDKGQLP